MSLEDEIIRLRESVDRLAALFENWGPQPVPDPARPPDDAGGLLTADQAARLLNVRKSWIYEQSRLGNIPRSKVGRFLRFEREKLLEWARDRSGRKGPEGP